MRVSYEFPVLFRLCTDTALISHYLMLWRASRRKTYFSASAVDFKVMSPLSPLFSAVASSASYWGTKASVQHRAHPPSLSKDINRCDHGLLQGGGNVANAAKAVGAHVVLISSCLVTKQNRWAMQQAHLAHMFLHTQCGLTVPTFLIKARVSGPNARGEASDVCTGSTPCGFCSTTSDTA